MKLYKKIILVILSLLAMAFLYLTIKSAPIDSIAYKPKAPPALVGVLAKNNLLQNAKLLLQGQINGLEEVAINSQGLMCAGTQEGEIKCLNANGQLKILAVTHGRPLGMLFDENDNLIVCDAAKGLLSINQNGNITVLVNEVNGVPFKFTDALDIAKDGMIYFTDASDKYPQSKYLFDLMESRPHGRFMRYNPETKKVTLLMDNMYFANGVALSENEDFVLINETYRYRIQKYWLKGAKTGTHEIFMDNLPGFPDNITSNRQGTFWLALFTVRNATIDKIHPYPFIKTQISKLPKLMWPKPKPYGLVLAINEQAEITQSLHEPTGKHLSTITSVREHGGFLYLGSLHNDRIGKYKLEKTVIEQ